MSAENNHGLQFINQKCQKFVLGEFHQGSLHHFPPSSVGRQCVPNSLIALLLARIFPPRSWDPLSINCILESGDELYRNIYQKPPRYKPKHAYMSVSEIPNMIMFMQKIHVVKIVQEISGVIQDHPQSVSDMCDNLNSFVVEEEDSYCLVIIGTDNVGSCMALVVRNEGSFMFDAHARDPEGMPSSDGSGVLLQFNRLSDCCDHIHQLANALGATKYEVSLLKITEKSHVPKELKKINVKVFACYTGEDFDLTELEKQTQNRGTKRTRQEYMEDYRLEHEDHIRQKKEEYRSKNTEKCREYGAEYYLKNCEQLKKSQAEHYNENRKCLLAKRKKHAGKNAAKIKEYKKDYYHERKRRENSHQSSSNLEVNYDQWLQEKHQGTQHPNATDAKMSEYHQNVVRKEQSKFCDHVKEMPEYVCRCCHRMLYKQSVLRFQEMKYKKTLVVNKVLNSKYIYPSEYICSTCHRDLTSKPPKMPSQSAANGLLLPKIPSDLADLNDLERRFVSLRIPFMKLVALPKGGQYGIQGPCVNVPSTVTAITNFLPRLPDQVQVIDFKLKRMLKYKGHHMHSKICPEKVIKALLKLKDIHPAYKNISLNSNWEEECNDKCEELWKHLCATNPMPECQTVSSTSENTCSIVQREKRTSRHAKPQSDVDAEQEDILQLAADQQAADRNRQHVLQPFPTLLELDEIEQSTFSVAPGEGKQPKYIITDENFETLSFPDLFPTGVGAFPTTTARERKLDLRRYYNQRLLNVDGRFAANIEYLLASQYATELKQVKGNIGIAMRLKRGQSFRGQKVTAGMLQNTSTVKNLLYHGQAYKFLQTVRGTPAYWAHMMLENLAMLKQLGVPTFFFTVSANDYHWPEIIQTIAKQYGESFTSDEVLSMSWETKSMWLRSNPVTAVRAFLHRFKHLEKFIRGPARPFGEVTDFVFKVEFQARGSPHIHSELWVKGAPRHDDPNINSQVVADFVDRYITAKIPDKENEPDLHALVTTVQQHVCSSYCRKKAGVCRFGFEKIPSFQTLLAHEIDDEDITAQDKLTKSSKLLKAFQEAMQTHPEASHEDLLHKTGTTPFEYEEALKIGFKGSKIVLKRNRCECRTNPYNTEILMIWRANMDVQYIEDAVGAVMYVSSYMMKSEKGMGELLRRICKEVQDQDMKSQLKEVGRKFLGSREVSAQEAAMRILSLPLMKKSRTVTFVNTDPKDKRIAMPRMDLHKLEPDDEDIFAKSIHDRYAARPDSVESITLADFTVNYSTLYEKEAEQSNDLETDDTADIESTHISQEDQKKSHELTLKNGLGKMRQRQRRAVLRIHRTNRERNPENFFYQRVLMFHPWRNEEEFKDDPQTHYIDHQEAIEENAKKYNHMWDEIESAADKLHKHGAPQHLWDTLAPAAQQTEAEAEAEGCTVMRGETIGEDNDNFADSSDKQAESMSSSLGQLFTREAQKNTLDNDLYKEMFRALNGEQRNIVNFNRNWCKEFIFALRHGKVPPAYQVFLSGPGGTGKSHVIKMIHRDVVKMFNRIQDTNPNDPSVLLTAFTGTAAFNIDGITLHSALCLTTTPNQRLSHEKMTVLQERLKQLRLLVIDEVSMISEQILEKCHQQLCKAKHLPFDAPAFANTSILAVGDFYQLKPVGGTALFANRKPTDVSDLAPKVWDSFQLVELTKSMRQSNDDAFAKLLNSVRVKSPEENSTEDQLLRSRELSENSLDYPESAMHVFSTNALAAKRNAKMLEQINSTLFKIQAKDTTRDRHANLAKFVLPKDFQKTGRLFEVFEVKKSARVMLTHNIDVTDGLTNGAMGTVTHVQANNGEVTSIFVKFDHNQVGTMARRNSATNHICKDSVSIHRIQATFFIQGKKSAEVTRTQFPLMLSWAVTIHKVQGLTLDKIVVNMAGAGGMWQCGQAYVAFSRVKKLTGLHIVNYDRTKIKPDPKVQECLEEMRQNRIPVEPPPLTNRREGGLLLTHQNVDDCKKNSCDIDCQRELIDGDIVCMTETKLKSDSPWPLTSITKTDMEVFRSERSQMAGGGIAVCVRKHLKPKQIGKFVSSYCEFVHLTVEFHRKLFHVICCYKRPQANVTTFLNTLLMHVKHQITQDAPCVILGDLNVDIMNNKSLDSKLLLDRMKQLNFRQEIKKYTTDMATTIDLIFTRNVKTINSQVTDCYYTYHDSVAIAIC